MPKAIWNGVVIAESNRTEMVEGNHYFPPETVKTEFLSASQKKTICGWKGEASYYNIEVNGQTNLNAAWYYPNPKSAANNIKGYVAFWRGVKVEP